jgi:hypothetical protein
MINQNEIVESGSPLNFNTLREANAARLPQFKNSKGGLAHSKIDGSDWSPAQWLQAVMGELGEYANIRKKYERGDIDHREYAVLAAKELADVQTYLDILARRALDYSDGRVHPTGVDLGQATIAKFNEVSNRVGSSVFIDGIGGWYYKPEEKPVMHVAVGFRHGLEDGWYYLVTPDGRDIELDLW